MRDLVVEMNTGHSYFLPLPLVQTDIELMLLHPPVLGVASATVLAQSHPSV